MKIETKQDQQYNFFNQYPMQNIKQNQLLKYGDRFFNKVSVFGLKSLSN